MSRRLPRLGEALALVGPPDLSTSRVERGLSGCASVWDVRALAQRRVPRPVFDYVDGAAMSEASLRRAREAFARVAAERRLPYVPSTLGTTSAEDLAALVPESRRWFQLYVSRDRAQANDLMKRAWEQGFSTLVLTVDTCVGGIRRREIRNGPSIPPRLTIGTLAHMALYPRWWVNVLTTEPLRLASLSSTEGTVGDLLTRVFDRSVTTEDLDWIRAHWPGSTVVTGIQCVQDAEPIAGLGVEGLVLSNHGGRQIDMGTVPLELLPEVVDRVGARDFDEVRAHGVRLRQAG